MRTIRLTSLLPVGFRDELERIVFFNPEQRRLAAPIIDSVKRYGVPFILEEGGHLRFRVQAFGEMQTLYALDEQERPERLVGVAMFVREAPTSVILLHLAVHEHYTLQGRWAEAGVAARLVSAVRQAAERTHGVETLRILYRHALRLPVRERKPLHA
jgi:hypothetical protein